MPCAAPSPHSTSRPRTTPSRSRPADRQADRAAGARHRLRGDDPRTGVAGHGGRSAHRQQHGRRDRHPHPHQTMERRADGQSTARQSLYPARMDGWTDEDEREYRRTHPRPPTSSDEELFEAETAGDRLPARRRGARAADPRGAAGRLRPALARRQAPSRSSAPPARRGRSRCTRRRARPPRRSAAPASRSSRAAARGSWRRATAARATRACRRSGSTSSCRTSSSRTPTSTSASTSTTSSRAR